MNSFSEYHKLKYLRDRWVERTERSINHLNYPWKQLYRNKRRKPGTNFRQISGKLPKNRVNLRKFRKTCEKVGKLEIC